MTSGQLDETDQKILRHFQEDARMDLGRLAVLVHKTVSTVSRRITSLTKLATSSAPLSCSTANASAALSLSSSWSCWKNKPKLC